MVVIAIPFLGDSILAITFFKKVIKSFGRSIKLTIYCMIISISTSFFYIQILIIKYVRHKKAMQN